MGTTVKEYGLQMKSLNHSVTGSLTVQKSLQSKEHSAFHTESYQLIL